jgi:hypothetical protein
LSAFGDKGKPPTEDELRRALAAAAPVWARLVAHVTQTCPAVTEQWNFAGTKFGWSMRLRSKDRIVLYLIPQAGQVLVGIVLGARAVAAAAEAALPAAVRAAIAAAPRYAEGTGLRLPVVAVEELPAIFTLVALKMDPER